MKKLILKPEVADYQTARQLIPKFRSFSELLTKLRRKHITLNESAKNGIFREFRAYWWLSKKYKNHVLRVSSLYDDYHGVDLIGQDKFGNLVEFQVSGFAENHRKKRIGAKLILVSDRGKIYQQGSVT